MLSLRFQISQLKNNTPLSPPKHKPPFSPINYYVSHRIKRDEPNAFLSITLPKFPKFVVAASNSNVTGGENFTQEEDLPEGLRRELMPKHVAVIMDGNRRWAQNRGLSMEFGHRAGRQRMKNLSNLCSKWGIKVLTVFAFSTENWSRPKVEVDFLMSMFEEVVNEDIERCIRKGTKLSVIGDLSKLPKSLSSALVEAMESTKANTRFHFVVALNYSGQHDIIQACQDIAHKAKDGLILPQNINKLLIEEELQTKCIREFPCPDLIIRTSGEIRISNFMLWQMAYSELYFADVLFPDFDKAEFVEALRSFQHRQRRYGGHEYGGQSKLQSL